MDTLNQSTSTSIEEQYKHNVEVTPKVWMQDNRFLPHQLLPNTHMLSILLMQCLRVKLMHKNWVWKGYDQSVNLHAMSMKMILTQNSW